MAKPALSTSLKILQNLIRGSGHREDYFGAHRDITMKDAVVPSMDGLTEPSTTIYTQGVCFSQASDGDEFDEHDHRFWPPNRATSVLQRRIDCLLSWERTSYRTLQ